MEERIRKIEQELHTIRERNVRVEGDKAWETSATRTAVLALMTFVFTSLALYAIDSENAGRNALIAAAGYVLSTFSLSFLKRRWIGDYVAEKKRGKGTTSGMARITFVDENDNVVGHGTKQEALQKGFIRRIVEVIVANSKGELLIQKRSPTMLLDPNKWDTSVGGHVDEGEERLAAAARETHEELGIINVPLAEVGTFLTEKKDARGIARRLVTLYSTVYDGPINFDKGEISDVKWIAPKELETWIEKSPDDFSYPLLISFKKFMRHHA